MNTSRKLLIAGATALAAAALASTASAQNSASTTGTASVKIIQPITIGGQSGHTTTLSFGTVVQNDDTITVAADGTRTSGKAGTLVGTTGASAAYFEVAGEPGEAIAVTVDPTVSMTGPGTSSLSVNLTPSGSPTTLGVDTGNGKGVADFSVGGNVTIASTTPNGAYSGTFNVTAAYN